MFHGEPGCGKTSTIKALANYTQRHIVSVSLSNIQTYKQLTAAFHNEYINHRKVPLRKRLYVLEDIDCAKLDDLVVDRKVKEKEEKSSKKKFFKTSEENGQNVSINVGLQPGTGNDSKPQLTMAHLLEFLDGTMEMAGRMLVLTTNYPERLDPALVRPGRIDVELNFGRCSSNTLVQMYEHLCGSHSASVQGKTTNDNFWLADFDKSMLPEDSWTPAEVVKILVKNIRSPINGLTELKAGKST